MAEWQNENGNDNEQSNDNFGHRRTGGFFSDDAEYAYRTVMRNGRRKTMGWSVAALISGVLAILCCCLGYTGIVFGAVAVALSIFSRKKLGYFDGMAIAGLILGIFGFVFGVAMLVMTYTLPEEVKNEIYKELQNALEAGKTATENGEGLDGDF